MLRDPHASVHSLPTYVFSAHTLLLTLSDSVPVNVGTDLEIDSALTDSHTRGRAVTVQEANCSNESRSKGQKDRRGRGLELRQEELRKPFWARGRPTRAQQAEGTAGRDVREV